MSYSHCTKRFRAEASSNRWSLSADACAGEERL
jgi:hypothetical protein